MNNLERIKAAWPMGWSATIVCQTATWQVVGFYEPEMISLIGVSPEKWRGQTLNLTEDSINRSEIIAWKYAGQLAGNEPIPEGQKFRVKETGDIFEDAGAHGKGETSTYLLGLKNKIDLSEIEPVFD